MNAETANHQLLRTPEQSGSMSATAHSESPLSGHVVIFSVATVLALATANECQSITHFPSLLYGAVLWGWWGCVTSAMWKLGGRAVCL